MFRRKREKGYMSENILEAKFDQEMCDTYTKAAKEIRYHATAFLHMMNEHGGVQTAKLLLQSNEISDGFTKLWQEGKLDISAEALVLKPEYAPLFSAEERTKARRRLADVRYPAPWDSGK